MKVALVIERLADRGGGVELAAYELLRELVRRDLDVTVVCRIAESPAPVGVRVLEVGGGRSWQPARVRGFSRRAAAATSTGFDLVHSYSRTLHQDVYRAGGGAHAEYVEQVYAAPALQRLLSPRHRALLEIEAGIFGDPQQVVECISLRDASEIRARHGVAQERLVTIYNGVDTERFHPAHRETERARIRSQLGVERPTALFAGRGFRRKGLERAIRGLAASGVDAELLVAGAEAPGRHAKLARELGVASRVHFLGGRADMPALHAASDLFVFPSRYDPFGNAALEALASGLPLVSAPTAGASELVEPGVNGLVCGGEDWAPAFELLRDPVALQRMASAARRTAERYTWSRHADAVVELYQRVRQARS